MTVQEDEIKALVNAALEIEPLDLIRYDVVWVYANTPRITFTLRSGVYYSFITYYGLDHMLRIVRRVKESHNEKLSAAGI